MNAAATAHTLVRVTVLSEDRRLDVGIPGGIPLVEVIPGFARSLGVLDPTLVHGGFSLKRADGTTLDSSLSATAQSVHDGDVLTLVRGVLLTEPRVYDDITEAVLDATQEQHREWTARDSSRTAIAISLTFLALCAILLLSTGRGSLVGALVAGGGALVLLAASAVLSRVGQPEGGNALGLSAAVFAAIGSFLAVTTESAWGWPIAAAGLAAAITGALALALSPKVPQIHLIPVAWGLVAGIAGTFAGLFPASAVPIYAITVATAGALSNLLPWLAFSSTRIKAISPMNDQDVFAAPTPIDAEDVKRRAATGARVLTSLRIAIGLAILLAAPIVASANLAGAALVALAFLGMMFQSRQAYARLAVLVVMLVGAVGLAATSLAFAAARPDLRPVLLGILLVVTAVLVALTLLTPRARLRLARLADACEIIILAAVLPLGVLATGWV